MSAPGLPYDPLSTRRRDAAETVNRWRLAESKASKKIADDRSAFFDRMALLNAGALTFSVTLLSKAAEQNPSRVFILHTAWALILAALGACLARNLSHQHYRFADVAAHRAEAEIVLVDVDYEVMSTREIAYSDSSEPFDQNRELAINKGNRDTWQEQVTEWRPKAKRHWRLVRVMEWIACASMFAGFLLLVTFAVLNS